MVVILVGVFIYYRTTPLKADEAYAQQLRHDVKDYLVNEKHYSSDEIGKLSIERSTKNVGKKAYDIAVVFKDDKDSTYYYNYDENHHVQQSSVTGKKHAEPQNK